MHISFCCFGNSIDKLFSRSLILTNCLKFYLYYLIIQILILHISQLQIIKLFSQIIRKRSKHLYKKTNLPIPSLLTSTHILEIRPSIFIRYRFMLYLFHLFYLFYYHLPPSHIRNYILNTYIKNHAF